MRLLGTFIEFALVLNMTLSCLIGLDRLVSISKEKSRPFLDGVFLCVISILSALTASLLENLVLRPIGIEFARPLILIVLIWGGIEGSCILLSKLSKKGKTFIELGIETIRLNGPVFAIAILVAQRSYDLGEAAMAGLGAGIGFTISAIILKGIRQRLEIESVPEYFKGLPIALISAGLVSLAFMALDGGLVSLFSK